jgi:hypothetical protein
MPCGLVVAWQTKLWVIFLVIEGVSFVIQQLEVLFFVPVDDQIDLPWPGKDLCVFDGRFIVDVVGIEKRVAFDDMQGITVKVASPVELGLIVEISDIDGESVSVPVRSGVAKPPIDMPFGMIRPIEA